MLLTVIYVANTFRISEDYHNEITQRLNKDVSSYIVEEVKGIYDGERIDKEQMGKLMHHVMALSPSTEVYLLDLNGTILQHVALKKVVKAEKVDLAPVKQFIQVSGEVYIKGDDPREIGGKKISLQHLLRLIINWLAICTPLLVGRIMMHLQQLTKVAM